MKTAALALAIFFNIVFLAVAALVSASESATASARVCAALVVAGLAGVSALLVLARLHRAPAWATAVMRGLAFAVPLLWLAGSMDGGRVSAPEAVFLAIVALLAWCSWRVYRGMVPSSPGA